ncbi:geranylgeranylglyceryl/heptaprenylglyceryl phosphate synthase [Saccharicrinis sp. FJH54]|uniref:geranylgeranylglyceryl/heptaprenylglyceryl phosphate synthase n=1 Tax=Saccharicrinis sp. FJH54 TaxID=3344665 RepID=UPI0035D4603B
MMIFDEINKKIATGKKQIALLIDPDKFSSGQLEAVHRHEKHIDLILVGGSFTFKHIGDVIARIKEKVSIPVILFPGDVTQLSANADALLMLSLISGRNPEYLIGNHVLAAPRIMEYGLEPIPTGYIVLNGGKKTAVSYISNTNPVPSEQHDIIVATALAGKYLGLKMIYLETGSGATHPASPELVRKVKSTVHLPLIVGGGIKTAEQLKSLFNAGADIAVIGTLFENNPEVLQDIIEGIH